MDKRDEQFKSTPAQLKAMRKYEKNNKEKTRAIKRAYYHKNKENIKAKQKEKYHAKKKINKKEDDEHSRNFTILKRKLKTVNDIDNPFDEWKRFDGEFDKTNTPTHNGQKMILLNKVAGGICKWCLCGHRTGKLVVKIDAPVVEKTNDALDVADQKAYEDTKKHREEHMQNALTKDYDESSLMAFVRKDDNRYILVGKSCANYFGLTKKEIAEAFKRNKNKINPPKVVAKKKYLTQDSSPLILDQNIETLSFGMYKGQTIESIYDKRGGDTYLEWIGRVCDLPQNLKESILDLLYAKTLC